MYGDGNLSNRGTTAAQDGSFPQGATTSSTDPNVNPKSSLGGITSSPHQGAPFDNTNTSSTTNAGTDAFRPTQASSGASVASMKSGVLGQETRTSTENLPPTQQGYASSQQSALGQQGSGLASQQQYGSQLGSQQTPGLGQSSQAGYQQQSGLGQGVQQGSQLESQTQSGLGHHLVQDPCATGAAPSGPTGVPMHHKGPHALETANRLDPNVQDGLASGTTGTLPHESSLANKVDPRVHDASGTTTGSHHHHHGHHNAQRDVGIVGGAGALGTAAYEADKHHQSNAPGATSTQTGSVIDPSASQHHSHHGHHNAQRDVGVVGGTGALGTAAYEANKHHQSNVPGDAPLQPATGFDDQRVDPSSLHHRSHHQDRHHHAGRDAALVGGAGAGAAGIGALEHEKHQGQGLTGPTGTAGTTGAAGGNTVQPHSSNLMNKLDPRVKDNNTTGTAQSSNTPSTSSASNNLGRDAAIGAGGLGAAGLTGTALESRRDQSGAVPGQAPMTGTSQPVGAGQTTTLPERHQGLEEGAAAGAGTGSGATLLEQHRQQHFKHAPDMQSAFGSKQEEKELKKEQKHLEKLHEQQEKDHDKELKKLEKEHKKEEKEAHKHDHSHHDKDKKEGLLHKILHPGDKKHDDETVTRKDDKHAVETAAGVGAVGAAAYEGDKLHNDAGASHARHAHTETGHHGRRHGHKDGDLAATTGVPAQEEGTLANPSFSNVEQKHPHGAHSHHGHNSKREAEAEAAAAGTLGHHDGKLHKEPPASVKKELAAQQAQPIGGEPLATEGYGRDNNIGGAAPGIGEGIEGSRAGPAAIAQQSGGIGGPEYGSTGTTGGGLAGSGSTSAGGIVKDPITGLPVNPAKGTATGGTDGNAAIHDAVTRQGGQL